MKNRSMVIKQVDSEAGFTLIEVLIALAIIVTVGLSMIGTIPTGFKNVQKAADLSVISRIVQSIASDSQSSDWDEYSLRFSTGELVQYYDDQGNTLEKGGSFNHVYTALIETSTSSSGAQGATPVTLPGDNDQRIIRKSDLRKLIIRITTIPGEQGLQALRNATKRSDFSEHFVIVSNFKKVEENDTQ